MSNSENTASTSANSRLWPRIDVDDKFRKDLRQAFELFDKNGDGYVSTDAAVVTKRYPTLILPCFAESPWHSGQVHDFCADFAILAKANWKELCTHEPNVELWLP
ncbi:unnamed protein product [Protopolystoma xenopodis]|uniref:EF-hand domain-containing protein n=1 Tax=Protopolystoma xenopodis TaxID=117903 RepID=A0A448WT56_9PLAT|nr:unnamed protein product [Protopolystoma xenopodis]